MTIMVSKFTQDMLSLANELTFAAKESHSEEEWVEKRNAIVSARGMDIRAFEHISLAE